MEQCATEFKMESLESFEPLVNPIRQYRNRSKRTLQTGEEKLAEVLAKIASLQKSTNSPGQDRTKVRTYNVKLRLKKSHLYKCYDCGSCFANSDFLELHEKSHTELGKGGDVIDLRQETLATGEEMSLKQNAWFFGDFDDEDDGRKGTEEDDDGEEEHIVQLDCTVEEGEDIFDIRFDRTKCEKTYTMKYKVKKNPVGKCEQCEKLFYSHDCFRLHKLEHEKFLDIATMEPSIDIVRSPRIEESTMMLDDSFYEALDVSDILERSGGGCGKLASDGSNDGRRHPETGITLKYSIIPRPAGSGGGHEKDETKNDPDAAKEVNQTVCQPPVVIQEGVKVKQEPLEDIILCIKPEPSDGNDSVKEEKGEESLAIKQEVDEDLTQPTVKRVRLADWP
ncbi:uncharacterized protein LOC128272077 [Anopheles cruzii]|uniref:uncharacterized protein LOC128272077 n=1 Tax=Anopheles cruzii TaxID=68878 RepID=UPI0022EC4A35|nr:uncharacterized protein LOC128272077 [Anopheles cruzii]